MTKIVKSLGTIDRSLSKKEIKEAAIVDAQAIIDAEKYDLLQVYVEMKRYEAYLSGVLQHLKTAAYAQAAEKGEKSFDYNEAKITVARTVKYDYSVDENWQSMKSDIEMLRAHRKEREAFLKKCNEKNELIDEETGEVISDFSLPKTEKEIIIVKL